MKLFCLVLTVLVSGCVTTIHHDITTVPLLEEPARTPATHTPPPQPKVVVRYKDRVVQQPSTCRFKMPTLESMPPVLVISDTASVKDREHDMALYIKTMRSYTTTTLARIQQEYSNYNRNCK